MKFSLYLLLFSFLSVYNCASSIFSTHVIENANYCYFAPDNSSEIYYVRNFGYAEMYCRCSKESYLAWLKSNNYRDYGRETSPGIFEPSFPQVTFETRYFKSKEFRVIPSADNVLKKIYLNNGGYFIYYNEDNGWLYFKWYMM
jgi:hypothetical protein